MITQDCFRIRQYGRTELALLYCPSLTPASAWRKLKLWIGANAELQSKLCAIGYNSRLRSFTPLQVSIIIEYLGEP